MIFIQHGKGTGSHDVKPASSSGERGSTSLRWKPARILEVSTSGDDVGSKDSVGTPSPIMSPMGKVSALSVAGKDGPETLVVPGGRGSRPIFGLCVFQEDQGHRMGFQCKRQTIWSSLKIYIQHVLLYICCFQFSCILFNHNKHAVQIVQCKLNPNSVEIEVNGCMFMQLCLPVHGVTPSQALTSSWRSPRSIGPFSLGASSINRVESWDLYTCLFHIRYKATAIAVAYFSNIYRLSNCNCSGNFFQMDNIDR